MSENVNQMAAPEKEAENSENVMGNVFAPSSSGASAPPPPFQLQAESGFMTAPIQRQEEGDMDVQGVEIDYQEKAGLIHGMFVDTMGGGMTPAVLGQELREEFIILSTDQFLALKAAYDSSQQFLSGAGGPESSTQSPLIANIYSTLQPNPEVLHSVIAVVSMHTTVTAWEEPENESNPYELWQAYDEDPNNRFRVEIDGFEEGQTVTGGNNVRFNVVVNPNYVDPSYPNFDFASQVQHLTILAPDGETVYLTGVSQFVPTQTGTYEATLGIGFQNDVTPLSLRFYVEMPAYTAEQEMMTDEAETFDEFQTNSQAQLDYMTGDAPAENSATLHISSSIPASYEMDTEGWDYWIIPTSQIERVPATYDASVFQDGGSYEWYIAHVSATIQGAGVPAELSGLPEVAGDDLTDLGISAAYPVYRLPSSSSSASLVYSTPGRYAVIVRYTRPSNEVNANPEPETAIFWQTFLSEAEGNQIDDYEQELGSIDELVARLDPDSRVDVSSILTINENGQVVNLSMFYGQIAGENDFMLIDASPQAKKREYRGSYEDIMGQPGESNGEFARRNEYPSGVLMISIPGTDSESNPYQFNTDGSSNLSEAGMWLGVASTVLTLAAFACPVLAVPAAAMRVITLGAAATGTMAAGANILDELENANPNGQVLTLEALGMASALLGGAGELLNAANATRIVRGGRVFVASANIAVDGVSAMLVTVDGIQQLQRIDAGDPPYDSLSPEERNRRKGEIIANMALTGGLFVLSSLGNAGTILDNTARSARIGELGLANPDEFAALWDSMDGQHFDALQGFSETNQMGMLRYLDSNIGNIEVNLTALPKFDLPGHLDLLLDGADGNLTQVMQTMSHSKVSNSSDVLLALSDPSITDLDRLNYLLDQRFLNLSDLLSTLDVSRPDPTGMTVHLPTNAVGAVDTNIDASGMDSTNAELVRRFSTFGEVDQSTPGVTILRSGGIEVGRFENNVFSPASFTQDVAMGNVVGVTQSISFVNQAGQQTTGLLAIVNNGGTYSTFVLREGNRIFYPGNGGHIDLVGSTTTTVIGKFIDDQNLGVQFLLTYLPEGTFARQSANPGGVNILSVPEGVFTAIGGEGFWEQYNLRFLREAMERGDIIRLLSDRGTNSTGFFARELQTLETMGADFGYTFNESMQAYIKTS